METETERFKARWDLAAYKARCFINGTQINPVSHVTEPKSGHWSALFLDNPTVQLADAEGWSRDLRSAVFTPVRQRIMQGLACDDIAKLMPDEKWIAAARKKAATERAAAEWQHQQPMPTNATKGVLKPLVTGKAPFKAMQHSSPNRYLHRNPPGLTDRSHAMTGDRG